MKKIIISISTLLIILLISCTNDDDGDRRDEERQLNELLTEIFNLASMESCTNAATWAFTSYGSKACGGPVGYIAYPTTIDTSMFLQKVNEHRTAQEKFNHRYDVVSDCSIPTEPRAIVCVNGDPEFQY